MSTANFTTMKNFPLYTYPTTHWERYCEDCEEWFDEDEEVCPYCESENTVLRDSGYILADDFVYCVNTKIEKLNRGLTFHKVSIESGYYTGLQFYVEEEHDLERYEYDNDDCEWNFGMSRSRAYCMFYAERLKIQKRLAELAYEHGMDELFCVGVFSNGEAVYEKVEDTQRSRIMQAVAPRF